MVLEYYKSYINMVNVIPSWDVNWVIFPWKLIPCIRKIRFSHFLKNMR